MLTVFEMASIALLLLSLIGGTLMRRSKARSGLLWTILTGLVGFACINLLMLAVPPLRSDPYARSREAVIELAHALAEATGMEVRDALFFAPQLVWVIGSIVGQIVFIMVLLAFLPQAIPRIPCPFCQTRISSAAVVCPQCQRDIPVRGQGQSA